MEVSDLLEGLDHKRDVWRFVWTVDGAQCVMMLGELWMPVWPADSWDTLHTVSIWTLRKLNATNTRFIRLVTDHAWSLAVHFHDNYNFGTEIHSFLPSPQTPRHIHLHVMVREQVRSTLTMLLAPELKMLLWTALMTVTRLIASTLRTPVCCANVSMIFNSASLACVVNSNTVC